MNISHSHCSIFIVYFLMKKILRGVSIGVHAHTARNTDISHKVLNGHGEKEKDTDVFIY